MLQQPQNDVHHIPYPHKIAFLLTVCVVRMVGFEELNLLPGGSHGENVSDDAFLSALMVLVGAIDIEEFETGKLGRGRTVLRSLAGDKELCSIRRG